MSLFACPSNRPSAFRDGVVRWRTTATLGLLVALGACDPSGPVGPSDAADDSIDAAPPVDATLDVQPAEPDGTPEAPDAAPLDGALLDGTLLDGALLDGALLDAGRGGSDAAAPADMAVEPDAGTPAAACIELHHLLATTGPLPFPLSSLSAHTHFLLTEQTPLAPGDRLYLMADYQLAGARLDGQFRFMIFGLNSDYCGLELTADLDPDAMHAGPFVDVTGDVPAPIELAPYGGGNPRDPRAHGINIWDITDIRPIDDDCGGTVAEVIDYTPQGEPFILLWSYGGFGAQVYTFRIYHGRPGCAE